MPRRGATGGIAAVIFDLDGVLVDSESVWDDVRHHFVEEHGGHWHAGAQRDMMGMSSVEWSRYVRDRLGVEMEPGRISDAVADRVAETYRERLPLLPGPSSRSMRSRRSGRSASPRPRTGT